MRLLRVMALLFLSSPLWAQHTTVTATVLDPNGTPYVNCTGTANFNGQNFTPGAGPYTLGGGSFQTVVPIFCDSFGKFTVSLASNNVVTPTPSQWNFVITSATGYVPGNTYSFNTLITITGLTQDVSSALQAAAATLPIGGGGGSLTKWNSLLAPIANLSLNTGTFTTTFTSGDFGAAPVTGVWNVTDFSVSSTDTSTNFHVGTGNNSFHQPFLVDLTTGSQTFAQLAVYDLGTGHVGITAVGNILPPLPSGSYPGLPGNTGVNGVAKFTVMDNSPQHTSIRAYQNNNAGSSGTLADLFQMNTAAVYNGSSLTFNFWTACSGATQYVAGTSFGNGVCGGSNPGTILAYLRGDGTLNAANYNGPVNTVSFGFPPLGSTGYVCVLTSQTACSWQPSSGGGGGTGSQYQSSYFSATNVISGFGPGIPGQANISRGSVAGPIYASAGVAGGNGGTGVVSTNSYTIKCDDPTAGTLDRVTSILFTFSGSVAVTLPAPSVSGCGSNFTLKIGASTGTTVTVTSSATLVTLDGTSTIGSTLVLTPGQFASLNSPDNTVYHAWKDNTTTAITQTACDNSTKIATTAYGNTVCNVIKTSGSPFNMAGVTGVYWNNTSSEYDWQLDAPVAGKQYCFGNYQAKAQILKIKSTTSVTIYYKGVAGTTGTSGNLASAGAAGDFICLEGTDSTTYMAIGAGFGSWVNN